MAIEIGSCDVFAYDGGCETNKCFGDCRNQYGEPAHGYCYTIKTPNDTCMCRHPC